MNVYETFLSIYSLVIMNMYTLRGRVLENKLILIDHSTKN